MYVCMYVLMYVCMYVCVCRYDPGESSLQKDCLVTDEALVIFRATKKVRVWRLKMTTTQAVETSVTNNSLPEDYFHSDDHTQDGKQLNRNAWDQTIYWV